MQQDASFSSEFDPGPARELELVTKNVAGLEARAALLRELDEAVIGTAGMVQALGAQVSLTGVAESDVAAAWLRPQTSSTPERPHPLVTRFVDAAG